MKHFSLRSIGIAILCLVCSGTAQAQLVFIPDTVMRNVYNGWVPGCVDASGYLDATYPGVSTFNYPIFLSTDGVHDLSGLGYFAGLTTLELNGAEGDTALVFPALPPSLVEFTANQYRGSVLPAFPASLQGIYLNSTPNLSSLSPLPNGLVYFTEGGGQLTVLPSLPASLYQLVLYNLPNLAALPPLPSGLWMLNLANLPDVTVLPSLPSSIEHMSLNNVGVPMAMVLPSSLIGFGVGGMAWTSLPDLPVGLEVLGVTQNPLLASLPELPTSLITLLIDGNPMLTSLPVIPSGLITLHISGASGLVSIPDITDSRLKDLVIEECPLLDRIPMVSDSLDQFRATYLPLVDSINITFPTNLPLLGGFFVNELPSLSYIRSLPGTIDVAYGGSIGPTIASCPNLTCLPIIPEGTGLLYMSNTGVACVPNHPATAFSLDMWPPICSVVNSNCPVLIPQIIGAVFNDLNANGIKDGVEGRIPSITLQAQPGDYLAASDTSGIFAIVADTGTFAVQPILPSYQTLTTGVQTAVLTSMSDVDSIGDVGVYIPPGAIDLSVDLTSVRPPSPGFTRTIHLSVHNPANAIPGTLQLDYPPNVSWVSSSVPPTTQSAGTATWSLPMLAMGQTWITSVQVTTSTSALLGDSITLLATVTPDVPDILPADNTHALVEEVVVAIDPNDKQVAPSVLTSDQVALGTPIDYTIRFQNTGNWPASRVVITDTLSQDLVGNSLQLISSSHEVEWYAAGGVLYFIFDPIILPDSSSDEPGSHGFVKFRALPEPTLTDGAQIGNTANIYFDFNEPVITNEAIFTVDAEAGLVEEGTSPFQVFPNPAIDRINIERNENGAAEIRINDAQGRTIRSVHVIGKQSSIPLAGLAPGAYSIRVISAMSDRSTRFIKR